MRNSGSFNVELNTYIKDNNKVAVSKVNIHKLLTLSAVKLSKNNKVGERTKTVVGISCFWQCLV